MTKVVVGDGGSVIVAAALSDERADHALLEGLASQTTLPDGTPALPLDAGSLFSGSHLRVWMLDLEPATLRDANVEVSGIEPIDPLPAPGGVHVVAVSAGATGSGKTALTRRMARGLRRSGVRTVVLRHPTPNRLLWPDLPLVEVIRERDDIGTARPFEEREELTPVIGTGVAVVVGVDPVAMLDAAGAEAGPGGVIVWDGGGAARPWVRPDLHVVVVDPIRPLPEVLPERVASADAVVITKADSAPRDATIAAEQEVRAWNAHAQVILADMPVAVPRSADLVDRRVVLVEDYPSVVRGELRGGAGAVAAKRFRCGVVDPRPSAVGAIAAVLASGRLGPVIPSLGRTPEEIEDLRASIAATPGDVVLWGSTATPEGICDPAQRPVIGAFPELMEVAGGSIGDVMRPLLPGGGA